MTKTGLKLVALVLMLIDRIAMYIQFMPISFRYIGRLSAPIFIFCTVQGFNYSSNKKRYLLRLYLFSVFMALIQFFITYPFGPEYIGISGNFPRTLFILCLVIYLFYYIPKEKKKKAIFVFFLYQIIILIIIFILLVKINLLHEIFIFVNSREKLLRFFAYLLPSLLGSVYYITYGLAFVVLGLLMNNARNDKKKLSMSFIAFTLVYFLIDRYSLAIRFVAELSYAVRFSGFNEIIYLVVQSLVPNVIGFDIVRGSHYQWLMIFSLLFMLSYNHKKGKGLKYLFYIFYPLHLIILYFIGNYIILKFL